MKVGDKVVITCQMSYRYCIEGKDLKNEIGKIIKIHNRSSEPENHYYEIDIINCPYKKECIHIQTNKLCGSILMSHTKPLNSLKLKKFIEHGVQI